MLQKQSSAKDDSIKLFIGAFTSSNTANAGVITNNISSILIGHNAGKLQGNTSLSKPIGIYSRFKRVWKVTNTNFTNSFSLEIEWDSTGTFDINDIVLLIDTNDDFTNAIILNSSNGLSFTQGSIIISGISTSHLPSNTTRFITIGSISPSTPLPIELISFSALIHPNKYVQLNWKTASERDNEYFTVERSTNLIHWYIISRVKSAGNSSDLVAYTTEDLRPLIGTTYYRLKQTDFDGKSSYSPIATINMRDIEASKLVLFPNPATNQLTIKGNPLELLSFNIYNVLGTEISSFINTVEKSATEISIDISQLPSGVYVIKTKSLVNTFVKK